MSLPICDRSFSPVHPRGRLAGPRPKPACSQRAPQPNSVTALDHVVTKSSRTRGRTHRYVHHEPIGRRTDSSPRARRYYADDDGDVARRHSTATDSDVRRVTLSMLRMIPCPFPAFFRFLMLPIVPSSIRFVDTTRVTISLYRRHPLSRRPPPSSLDGVAARADRLVGVAIGEKGREKERGESASIRDSSRREIGSGESFSLSMAPALKDERMRENSSHSLEIRKSRGGIREIRQFGQQTTTESLNFRTTRMSHAIDLLRLSAMRFKGAVAPRRVTLAVFDQRRSHTRRSFSSQLA